MDGYLYMCVYFLLFKTSAFVALVCALGKKDNNNGHIPPSACVYAGFSVSKLEATWSNHGYFVVNCPNL
jgi:hypothetical protein